MIDFLDATSQMRDPQTYAIIGAAMEVHRVLGRGFLEAVYQQAMAIEMRARGIPFEQEVKLTVTYKGIPLDCKYRADFLCFGEVVAEIKAISQLTGADHAQAINYLNAIAYHRALVLNFGAESLQVERVVWRY